jgi:hypothetical protein
MSNLQYDSEYYNSNVEEKPAMTMATGGNITQKYKAQIKQAGETIKVDPVDRFKTEQ